MEGTMRRAKILATLGPASANESTLRALMTAGLDAVRLNFSHGTQEQHENTVALVRRVARECHRAIGILGDLSGPKLRIGTFARGSVTLAKGQLFEFTTEPVEGDEHRVSVTYPLAEELAPGALLLLDDGLLRLRAERVEGPSLFARVEVGGVLSNRKGVNLPGARLKTPALTDKDRRDLEFGRKIGVDFFALSFVRQPDDVLSCKALAGDIPVYAKLEKPEAIANLSAIVEAADGVMVARGDLGVEMGAEQVPLLQKRIIRTVNSAGKIVITATQMLESMLHSPRPTRAEASDVANAVFDGTDVLMLSGETASGEYPVAALAMMDAIIREVEASDLYAALPEPQAFGEPWEFDNACTRAVATISRSVNLGAIVVATGNEHTVSLLADYRPRAPILAVMPEERLARRLSLQWGVVPVVEALSSASELTPERASELARTSVGAAEGDPLLTLVRFPGCMEAKALVLDRVRSPRAPLG
jgi:pyruvate kinase